MTTKTLTNPMKLTAAVVALTLLTPAPSLAGKPGATSPEELVEMLRQKEMSRDFGKLAELVHPDDRPMMGTMLFMVAGLGAAFSEDGEAATKRLEAIATKHGLDVLNDEDAAPPMTAGKDELRMRSRQLFADADVVAFLIDVSAFMESLADSSEGEEQPPAASVSDLKIDGDTASLQIDGKPATMGTYEGRWYLRADELF